MERQDTHTQFHSFTRPFRFGAAIMADTGTTVGKIDNLDKKANSCDVKPNRPYRAIAGADDFKVCFYEGPPFKYKCKLDVS